jgi:hypothetical protein
MHEDRSAYLVAIEETCNRQVEDEIKRIKEHFKAETRISKKKYKSEVEKLQTYYEELLRKCQEDLQIECNQRLTRELDIQKKELTAQYEKQLTASADDSKKIREQLEEESRINKKKNENDLKKHLKARYEGLVHQCQEELHREYKLLLSRELEVRERVLISEHEERMGVVIEEHNKREDDLRLQIVQMEDKFRDAMTQLNNNLNENVRQHLNMVSLEAQEKIELDVSVIHEKYANILNEKEALISNLNDDKVKAITDYQKLVKESEHQKLEIFGLKSKVDELLSTLRQSECDYVEMRQKYDHDMQQSMVNIDALHSDIYSLNKALKTEARHRSTEKSKFRALEESWATEKHELCRKNEALSHQIIENDQLKSAELNQIKRSLQGAIDDRDITESKLKSTLIQIGLLEQDIVLIKSQMLHQTNTLVKERQDHENDIHTLQVQNSDFQRDFANSWIEKNEALTKERSELQRKLDNAEREKEDLNIRFCSLEKLLEDVRKNASMDMSYKEQELCTAQHDHQEVLSKLSKTQDENVKLKDMIAFMRKDMDLMISLKPDKTKTAPNESNVEEVLLKILTTVRDKLDGSETVKPSIQLDDIKSCVDDLKSSVNMINMSQR